MLGVHSSTLATNVRNSHFCQSDETAVLKHFNWPEKKADALREAASEYRHLKCLLTEISSLRDGEDGGSGSEATATLKKISSLLDKCVWQQQSSLYTLYKYFFFNAIATKLKIYMSPIRSALQIGEEHGQIGESKEIGDVVLQRVEDSD